MDDAEGPNVYETPGGDRYRLVEWRPGEPRKGVWEMGHIEGREYRRLKDQYMRGEIAQQDFLREYRNPRNYMPVDPDRNHAHVDEAKP